MTPRRSWVPPKLLVLVKTTPADGVMQIEVCKFFAFFGPGDGNGGALPDCALIPPGVPTCLAQQPS
jgi:hypothetical protein